MRRLKLEIVLLALITIILSFSFDALADDELPQDSVVATFLREYKDCSFKKYPWVEVQGRCLNIAECSGSSNFENGFIVQSCPIDDKTGKCPTTVRRCGFLASKANLDHYEVALPAEINRPSRPRYQCQQAPQILAGTAAFIHATDPVTKKDVDYCAMGVDCSGGAQTPIACTPRSVYRVTDPKTGKSKKQGICRPTDECLANRISKPIDDIKSVRHSDRKMDEKLAQEEGLSVHAEGSSSASSTAHLGE